jgi:hypothetical protein
MIPNVIDSISFFNVTINLIPQIKSLNFEKKHNNIFY